MANDNQTPCAPSAATPGMTSEALPVAKAIVPPPRTEKTGIRHPYLVVWVISTLVLAGLSSLNANPENRINILLSSLLGCGILVGIICGVVYVGSAVNKANKIRKAEAERQRRAQLREFLLRPMQPMIAPAIMLKNGEACYGQWAANICTMHKYTQYVGGSSGVSFRVARGVYIRSSAFRGRPISTQQMQSDGSGTLYITNKRLLFIASAKTVEIPFGKIASTEPYTDGMRVDIANKPPVIFATGNGWLALYFHRIQQGLFEATPEAALPDDL